MKTSLSGSLNGLSTSSATCPALFIAAPSSGVGKTSVTAGLARYHRRLGRDVRVFKVGPDYLDPKILEIASGNPVYQLDLWMVGEKACRRYLYQAAVEADFILIEGAMGLFDGNPSGADIAQMFNIPVLAVIDARAMAQTFAAVAHGLATFRPGLSFAGVVATQLRSEYHQTVIQQQMPDSIATLAVLPQSDTYRLPVRHLGLVQPGEQNDLDKRLNGIADVLANSLLADVQSACEFELQGSVEAEKRLLMDTVIGIARDEAFSFIYPANIDSLIALGAELKFFSPLHDSAIPEVDSLWFPGGYPELYIPQLSQNVSMKKSIVLHYKRGKKIYAECGGLMYMTESIRGMDGGSAKMVGILKGHAAMTERSGCQGMQATPLPEGILRGHAHHRSTLDTDIVPISYGQRTRNAAPGEPIYRMAGLTASYLHSYFPSNPEATAAIFNNNDRLVE